MEKDYWTASRKFWQTVWCLRRGKQLSANTVYSGGGELLASTGDIVRRWKEYFEDLLNATDMPSVEEPEAEDSERMLEGSWEFAQPVHMCFVDLEKAFNRVPRGILWEVLWEYGVHGPLLRAVRSLYDRSRSLVLIASYDVVLLAPSSLDLQHALGRFAAECEAAGMMVSTSKSEAIVLDRKKVACTLQVGGEFLPQVEEFKYLGVLFTSEGSMDREIDRRIGAAAAVMRSVYCYRKAKYFENTLNFIPDRSRPELTTTAIGAVDLQGAGGNWATIGRRSRGGRRVHRQREKRKGKGVGLRIGTLNVGTMTGKGRELADVMERRKVDILCVQETRSKGSKAHSIGAGFKLFYYGVDSKKNGVGVVLKEEFVRNVLEEKRVSDRVMSLKLEIEGVMLNVVSGYAPQVGCELEKKERFWSELDEVMESIPTGERVVIGADFNGHVGEGNRGDEEVMGKFGVKERNLEGQMVVDFAKRMDMAVVNTEAGA
ncbi:hypothetical protein QTP70_010272 [Hemibagrus guttatus]|uniref:Endonuclease/exonuclease/phosphatase domain-containing protein n=1 Tax=Hemibagrus guttatus TaxID=175788 RepID=A0AAE0R1H3_9TELE|nr:hypothetical protein QTP70_010272 [Hemibagrus guttatus]